MANSTANLRKTTSLVTRYSSGEDSDNKSENSAIKTRKSGRFTTSGSSPKAVPYPPLFNSQPLPSTKTTISSRSSQPSSSIGGGKNAYISPVIVNDSEDDEMEWNLKRNRSTKLSSNKNNTSFNSSSYGTNGNGYDNDEEEEEEDSNTTSEYTKRLLQFRQESSNAQKQQQQNLRKRPPLPPRGEYQPINENDIVYHAESYSETAHVPLSLAIRNFINRLDAAYGFKQTFVPMVLVTFLIIFFALIIFVYITISPAIENTVNPSTTIYTVCDAQHENEASYACIDEENLLPSLNLLKSLASELQKRAINGKCRKSLKESSIMCIKDILMFLQKDEDLNVLDVMKDAHNVEYLIDRNKQWGISNVNSNGEIMTLDQVENLRAHQAECFSILTPKLPITCTLYNKLQTFFAIIGTLAILSSVFFAIRKFYFSTLR